MPTIPIEDGKLWYEETGGGPPLVCLHGGWQNHQSWRAQVDYFSDDYRVVTCDLRGHGRTGSTEASQYSIELFTDDFETLLSSLDVENPLIMGLSIGGMVAQSYLSRHSTTARGVIVGGPLQSMPPVDIPQSMKQMLSPLPLLAGSLMSVGPKMTFKMLLNSIQTTNGGKWLTVDEGVRTQAMAAVEAFSPREFRKVFEAVYDFVPPDLSNVSTPLLVLYGDHETLPVKQQGKRLARTVKSGSHREIAESGHLVNQDQPATFNKAAAAFFASLGIEAPDMVGD